MVVLCVVLLCPSCCQLTSIIFNQVLIALFCTQVISSNHISKETPLPCRIIRAYLLWLPFISLFMICFSIWIYFYVSEKFLTLINAIHIRSYHSDHILMPVVLSLDPAHRGAERAGHGAVRLR